MKRASLVGSVHIITVLYSSTMISGMTGIIKADTRGIAVQRKVPVFFEDEGNFEDYPIFSRDIPQWSRISDTEVKRINEIPVIRVGSVEVLSLTTSSAIHVGPNCELDLESRIKAIRHFITGYPKALEGYKGVIVLGADNDIENEI